MAMLIDKGESLIHKLSFQPWYSQGVVEHFFLGGGVQRIIFFQFSSVVKSQVFGNFTM